MLRRRFAFCAALLLALPPAGVGAAELAGLFSPDLEAAPQRPATRDLRVEAPRFEGKLRRGAPAPRGALRSSELRSRAAEVDLGQLEAARLDVEGRRPHRLNLNLFADAEFEAEFERSAATASGYTLTGRLAGQPLSTVVLAVNGDWVAGTVWSSGGRYAVRPLGGGVAEVRQLDPSALGRCGVGAESAEGPTGRPPPEASHRSGSTLSKSAPLSEAFPEDDGSVIDLLVVYPSFARRSVGGHLNMRALIDGDVALTNEMYRASGASQRINLVGAVEVQRRPAELADRNMSKFIDRLVNGSDGYMDEVHGLRDTLAADMVLAHWGDLAGTGALFGVFGIANQMEDLSGDYERLAFSAANSTAFAHELGHGMGLRHERANDPANTPFPYSHGYVGEDPVPEFPYGVQTIMASIGYEPKDIPRFSNLNQRYPDEFGVVIGVPGDDPSDGADGPANAVRSLNGTRRVVANFRRSAARCRYELTAPEGYLPAAGGEFRIGVRTGPGCAWSAWSNEDFVSVAEGAKGVGDGEVAFRVSANGGWEREVAVFVAGESYLAEQATGRERRAPPLVCKRNPKVRDAITAAAGKETCGEVTASDLASIRTLDLSYKLYGALDESEGALPLGSVDGLTGLVFLDLRGNDELTVLEPGLFDGLTKLTVLDLRSNGLTALRADVFDGVPNLARLELWDNPKLATLEPGAFRGLANMERLSFSEVGLTELRAGAFEGLSNLWHLDFWGNPLRKVEPGAFQGLSKLFSMYFPNSRDSVTIPLASLEPGVFDGLDNLNALSFSGFAKLTDLPSGLFNGLDRLKTLYLADNNFKTLELGVFDGLDALTSLILWESDLQSLEPGVFDGLDALELLLLDRNELRTLELGVFDNLPNLWWLDLSDNRLATVRPNLFRGLNGLRQLELDGNQLTALPRDLFRGLGQLWYVDLSRNSLRTVPPSLFDDQRSRMDTIKLGGNRLTSIDPSLLRGMASMGTLQLSDNGFAALPHGLFNGLYGLLRMDLSGNPGTPFAFRPEFVRAEGFSTAGGAAEVALALPQGAAFDLRVGLAVSGGSLSADESLIRVGRGRGEAVAVARDGAGPVTVHMVEVSEVPGPSCEKIFYAGVASHCWKGVRTALGAPLVLFGLSNQALAPGGAVRFDLGSAFPDFPDGTTYAVEVGDPAVAEAALAEGLLTVAATGRGATTVSVTAQDADGRREVRSFTVTVEQAANSYWRGWRSVLLKSPSSAESDGS